MPPAGVQGSGWFRVHVDLAIVYCVSMKDFLQTHQAKIKGVLSCFDRVLFRGYLPIQDGFAMAQFLNQNDIRFRNLKSFLTENAKDVKEHARHMAAQTGRPFEYLKSKIKMERQAREMADRDNIEQGLVCIFTILEPCRSYSFRFEKGRPFVNGARRKCLSIYYYFMDLDFGLIHVKVQTWFPMATQIYVNGQEWLARKLSENGIAYTKLDNVFIHVKELERAQAFSDRFTSLDWPTFLSRYAHRVNPLMSGILHGQSYYWVTTQSEYATDVLFKNRTALKALCPRLLSHSTLCFGAKDVISFLGKKLHGKFEGEIVTDLLDFAHKRLPGTRVKHRVKQNWLKMYDKAGMVLRIETVINNPEDFRVRRKVMRRGLPKTEWVQMRKGVSNLFRYRDVSMSANARYLDSLSVVEDPTSKVRELDRITTRKRPTSKRSAKAFNPLSREDVQLFRAVMDGEHNIRGFTNRNIREKIAATLHFRGIRQDTKRQSAKVTRLLYRFHVFGLIAKIPRSRRWRTTRLGRRVMATAIQLRELNFPQLLALAA